MPNFSSTAGSAVRTSTFNTEKPQFKTFKEFNRTDKEKIASVIESNAKEFILSPIVEGYVFASSRALDYGDITGSIDSRALWEHAVNKNADYFDTTVIHEEHPERKMPRYMTFKNAGMYKDHQSKNVENSIGFIFDAYDVKEAYEDMHITLLFGIDKTKAPRIARDLETYPTKVPTSMGCSITGASCTVCGEPRCDHLKYMRGGRINGKKVAEFLHGVEFFEDSVVSTPACHTAYVLDALVDIVPGRLLKIASESDDMMITAQIMKSIYESIRQASTLDEKSRLSDNLDRLLIKLEGLAEIN